MARDRATKGRQDRRWIAPSEFQMDQVLDLTRPEVHSRLAPELASALARPSEAGRSILRAFGRRLKQSGARGIIVHSWRCADSLNLVILDSTIQGAPTRDDGA